MPPRKTRKPLFLDEDGMTGEMGLEDVLGARLDGEYTTKVPLPRELAQRLYLSQGRGANVTSDYRRLDTTRFQIDPDTLYLQEEVRNVRIFLENICWEWDQAGQAWLKIPIAC